MCDSTGCDKGSDYQHHPGVVEVENEDFESILECAEVIDPDFVQEIREKYLL